jgi:hypothetical protein
VKLLQVFLFAILLSFGTQVMSQTSGPEPVGKVMWSVGKAYLKSAQGDVAVTSGTPVFEGQTIFTKAGGNANLAMMDGGFLSVRSDSSLTIKLYHVDFANPANTRILLEAGKGVLRSITGKGGQMNKEGFRLNTPVAAIGIRGTDFTVFTDDTESRVTLRSGAVVVSPFSALCTKESVGACVGIQSVMLMARDQQVMADVNIAEQKATLIEKGRGVATPDIIAPPHPKEDANAQETKDAPVVIKTPSAENSGQKAQDASAVSNDNKDKSDKSGTVASGSNTTTGTSSSTSGNKDAGGGTIASGTGSAGVSSTSTSGANSQATTDSGGTSGSTGSSSVPTTSTKTGSGSSVPTTATTTGSSSSVPTTATTTGSSSSVPTTATTTGSSSSVPTTATTTGSSSTTTGSAVGTTTVPVEAARSDTTGVTVDASVVPPVASSNLTPSDTVGAASVVSTEGIAAATSSGGLSSSELANEVIAQATASESVKTITDPETPVSTVVEPVTPAPVEAVTPTPAPVYDFGRWSAFAENSEQDIESDPVRNARVFTTNAVYKMGSQDTTAIPALSPSGTKDFDLTKGEAVVKTPSGLVAAEIANSHLSVNFANNSFTTGMDVKSSALVDGGTSLYANGTLAADTGALVSTSSASNMSVMGDVSNDASQAGYLFEQAGSDGTTISGATEWQAK